MLIPFSRYRVRLIDDYHKVWRFSSMRCLAVGAACQGTVVLTPDKVAQYAPSWLMSGLSTVAVICTVLAAVGRTTKVEHRDHDNEHQHEHIQDGDH